MGLQLVFPLHIVPPITNQQILMYEENAFMLMLCEQMYVKRINLCFFKFSLGFNLLFEHTHVVFLSLLSESLHLFLCLRSNGS